MTYLKAYERKELRITLLRMTVNVNFPKAEITMGSSSFS